MIGWRDKTRLRPRELAEVASISLRTVREKIRSGEIESYLEHGCRFVPIAAARRFARDEDLEDVPSTPGTEPTIRHLADEILADLEGRG